MRDQHSIHHPKSVSNIAGALVWLALSSELDAQVDQRLANRRFRGKSFGGDLGDGAAISDVSLLEEIFVLPQRLDDKINGVNKTRV